MGNFLTPVLALIIWTLIMWLWMYKRRIPAMMAMTKNIQDFIENPKLKDDIPAKARWAADNYNHLHEQPVIFYALMFYLSLSELEWDILLYLAWAYVAIRVVHSLVQVTSNQVKSRFSLFVLGSLVLVAMTGIASYELLSA